MPLQTFDLDCVAIGDILGFAEGRAAAHPEYKTALPFVYDAYQSARRNNLRFNRKTWTMRDNRLGVLSRPTSLSDYPEEATPEEARHELCRSIWCDAVRNRNLAQR